MHRISHLFVTAILFFSVNVVSAADFFFKDGDVVVMIGDSITEQHLYSNYVEMWTVTRFPSWKLTFRNVGIGGDTSPGGNSRFSRDILIHKPTAMTVDFGMNDGRYRPVEDSTYQPYVKGLQGIADQAKEWKIRTAWLTPQAVDNTDPGPTALVGYNLTLEKFSEGVKQIAEANAGLFVDQFHPYLAALDKARGSATKYERITGGADAVHPGPPGQALMAASILKGLSFPSLVSSAEIDATEKKVTSSANCTVSDVAFTDGSLTFSRLDKALPFYPADAAGILPWAPILEELNDYSLKVTGLGAGKYEVRIDGTRVTEVTAEQLAAGVNLASAALAGGPIADQVKSVVAAVEKKNRYHHEFIFRGIVLNGAPAWVYDIIPRAELDAKKQKLIHERLDKLPPMDAEIAKALEIKAHKFEIVPVK